MPLVHLEWGGRVMIDLVVKAWGRALDSSVFFSAIRSNIISSKQGEGGENAGGF